MKNVKNVLVVLVCLSPAQMAWAASVEGITIRRVQTLYQIESHEINEAFLSKLKEFHKPTSSADRSPRPDISKLERPNRHFIAKIDTFGIDRYFAFSSNDDVDRLVQSVRDGAGMDVSWYYYDEASEDPEATPKKSKLDISDLDKAKIVMALYAVAKPLGMGNDAFVEGDLAYSEAQEALRNGHGYVDYVKGRCIKVNLRGDLLDTDLFNAEYGVGVAERVIDELRARGESRLSSVASCKL